MERAARLPSSASRELAVAAVEDQHAVAVPHAKDVGKVVLPWLVEGDCPAVEEFILDEQAGRGEVVTGHAAA
jgi:hypothetical protein